MVVSESVRVIFEHSTTRAAVDSRRAPTGEAGVLHVTVMAPTFATEPEADSSPWTMNLNRFVVARGFCSAAAVAWPVAPVVWYELGVKRSVSRLAAGAMVASHAGNVTPDSTT